MKPLFMLAGILAVTTATYAEKTTGAPKTYMISQIQPIIANHDQCNIFFRTLEELTKAPVVLQFSKDEQASHHTVEHHTGQLAKHFHVTLHQTIDNNLIQRVGVGSFELNQEKVDYLIHISADTSNPNHHYRYPAILSSHRAQCYYSAVIEPNQETVNTFKTHIQSGAVTNKTDLTQP